MRQALFVPVLVISSTVVSAQEGGIEIFAGETLFQEGWRLSISHIYKRQDRLFSGSNVTSDPADLLREEHRTVVGVDYGLLPDLTLSALVPSVYREQRVRGPGGSVFSRSEGLGDIALLGKYRIFNVDCDRSSLNVAAIVGLETPTGDTDDRDNGMRLAPSLQVGSGSWDPFAAIAATTGLDRWRIDALVLAKVNTEGSRDFAHGDFFAGALDVGYRFLHTRYPGPTASAKIGLHYRHEEADEIDGTRQSNSGLDQLFLHTGVSVHPLPELDLSLSVDVPIYHDVRGTQLVRDLRLALAFGIRF